MRRILLRKEILSQKFIGKGDCIMKRIVSALLALIIALSMCSLAFAADGEDENETGVSSSEAVEVSAVYVPLKNRIAYNRFLASPNGIVLKVTYRDGRSEILTVKQDGEDYRAGDFNVTLSWFFLEALGQPSNYGMIAPQLYISKIVDGVKYEGAMSFKMLSIPNMLELVACIKTIVGTDF